METRYYITTPPLIYTMESIWAVSYTHLDVYKRQVLALLSGHTHENINTTFYGVPAYTAESTALGVAINEKGMYMTPAAGFNLCTVTDRTLRVETMSYPPNDQPITEPIPLEALGQRMKNA